MGCQLLTLNSIEFVMNFVSISGRFANETLEVEEHMFDYGYM